jgi:hypothetical protein
MLGLSNQNPTSNLKRHDGIAGQLQCRILLLELVLARRLLSRCDGNFCRKKSYSQFNTRRSK